MRSSVDELRSAIKKNHKICVFTGAGISCPSGIPDFRSAGGIYNIGNYKGYAPEEIISSSFFRQKTEVFFDYYKSMMLFPEAAPNLAHKYFASLEAAGKDVTVVTQNIDGLHQAAGSKKVIELHGNVHRNYCMTCGCEYSLDYVYESQGVPLCMRDGGIVKPDVVLYEESLDADDLQRASEAIKAAEVLIVVGTSLTVYPAAGLIGNFFGKKLALINKSATSYDERADLVIDGNIVDVVERLMSEPC